MENKTWLDNFNIRKFNEFRKNHSLSDDLPASLRFCSIKVDRVGEFVDFLYECSEIAFSNEFGYITFLTDKPYRTQPYHSRILAMYLAEANRGVIIDGKTYSEAWLDYEQEYLEEFITSETKRIKDFAKRIRNIEKQPTQEEKSGDNAESAESES